MYCPAVTEFRYAQLCPVARAVEILGERWTLLVVRELFCGPQRFSDLRRRLPGVSPSVLSRRLAALEARGIARRRRLPPPAAAQVYELAEAGRALERPMGELMRWGLRWLTVEPGDHFEPEWFALGLRFCARRDATPAHRFRLTMAGPEAAAPPALDLWVEGGSGGTQVLDIAEVDGRAADLSISGAPLALMGFATQRAPSHELLASGALRTQGDATLLDRFPECFDFSLAGTAS